MVAPTLMGNLELLSDKQIEERMLWVLGRDWDVEKDDVTRGRWTSRRRRARPQTTAELDKS